tara:strand:- start:1172 stop:1447 length:276 start_codon:yes stop_codon:yes gene_type:complete
MDSEDRKINPDISARLLEGVVQPAYQPRLKIKVQENRRSLKNIIGHVIVPLYSTVRYLINPDEFQGLKSKALFAYDLAKCATASILISNYL